MQVEALLSDPFFWIFGPLLWVLIYSYFDNPIQDGYHTNGRVSLADSDDLYIVLITIPEAVIFSYLTRILMEFMGWGGIFDPLGVTHFTIVLSAILVARFWFVWTNTLGMLDLTGGWRSVARTVLHTTGLFTGILFGTGLGVAIVTSTQPDPEVVRFLYERHVLLAAHLLEGFQALLTLQVILLPHMWSIFENNVGLGLRAAVLGVVGGLSFGHLIPAVLVMAMNAAIIWGVFTGILIRGMVASGSGILAAPLGYLASLGLLIFGHTFHEFMAIMVIGVGGAFVGYGMIRFFAHNELTTAVAGVAVFGIGVIQMGIAAALEVFVSPLPVRWVTGYVTVETSVVPLQTDLLAVLSVGVTTVGVAVAIAWMIQVTTREIESYL